MHIGGLMASKNRIIHSRVVKVCKMEAQLLGAARVKLTLQLGSETYSAFSSDGLVSQQLISVKEQSMSILKEFITKNNIPNDVPDDPEEISSDDEDEAAPKPPVKKLKNQQ